MKAIIQKIKCDLCGKSIESVAGLSMYNYEAVKSVQIETQEEVINAVDICQDCSDTILKLKEYGL